MIGYEYSFRTGATGKAQTHNVKFYYKTVGKVPSLKTKYRVFLYLFIAQLYLPMTGVIK